MGVRPLIPRKNLADLVDKAVARTNLQLGTGDSPTFAGLTLNGPANLNADILFGTNSAYDVGKTGARARNGWFGGTVVANDLSVVTTATVQRVEAVGANSGLRMMNRGTNSMGFEFYVPDSGTLRLYDYGTGTNVLDITNNGEVRALNGWAGFPSHSFRNDPDTGMFLLAANIAGISAGGKMVAQFDNGAGTAYPEAGTYLRANNLAVQDFISSSGVALKLQGGASGIQCYSSVVPNGSRSLGVNGASWSEVWSNRLIGPADTVLTIQSNYPVTGGTTPIIFKDVNGVTLGAFYGNQFAGASLHTQAVNLATIMSPAASPYSPVTVQAGGSYGDTSDVMRWKRNDGTQVASLGFTGNFTTSGAGASTGQITAATSNNASGSGATAITLDPWNRGWIIAYPGFAMVGRDNGGVGQIGTTTAAPMDVLYSGAPVIRANGSAGSASLNTSNTVHVPNLQADGAVIPAANIYWGSVSDYAPRLWGGSYASVPTLCSWDMSATYYTQYNAHQIVTNRFISGTHWGGNATGFIPNIGMMPTHLMFGPATPIRWSANTGDVWNAGAADLKLVRTASKTLTLDDNAGGNATLAITGNLTAGNGYFANLYDNAGGNNIQIGTGGFAAIYGRGSSASQPGGIFRQNGATAADGGSVNYQAARFGNNSNDSTVIIYGSGSVFINNALAPGVRPLQISAPFGQTANLIEAAVNGSNVFTLSPAGNAAFAGMLGSTGRLYTNQDLRIGSWVGNGFGPAVVNPSAVRLIDNLTPSGDMGLVWGSETSAYPMIRRSGTALRVELANASGTPAPFACSNLTANATSGTSSLRSGTHYAGVNNVNGVEFFNDAQDYFVQFNSNYISHVWKETAYLDLNDNGIESYGPWSHDGTLKLGSMADTSAAPDSWYFSTTAGKPVYQDASGVVHALY